MKTDKVNKKKIKVDLYLKGTKGNRSLIVKDKKGVEYNVYTIGWGIPVSLVIETEKETIDWIMLSVFNFIFKTTFLIFY